MNKTLLGICFAFTAAFMLSSMNVLAKIIGQYIGPIEITFYRNVVSIILLIAVLTYIKKLSHLKTERIWAHIIRTTIGTTAMVLIMWSFILMPLTTATSLHFTAPLFVTLLSYPLLKEKVGVFRFIFILIGFVGLASLLLKTQGFRLAPAAIISPISYTMMVWAILFDYLIWKTVPSSTLIIGATIIIASNLIIIWRENKVKKAS